jgi:hypothetical protein
MTAMILETLKGLFADKLVEDDREPIATFELPFSEQGSVWGLYPPKLHLWHQLIMVSRLLSFSPLADISITVYYLFILNYACPSLLYYTDASATDCNAMFLCGYHLSVHY